MRADRWRVKIKLFKFILPRRRNRETVFVKRTLLFVGFPVEYFPFLSTFGERTRARAPFLPDCFIGNSPPLVSNICNRFKKIYTPVGVRTNTDV